MPYTNSQNQYSRGLDETILASGALTVTGTSAAVETNAGTLRVQVQVSAVSGTSPNLTVTVQTSHDAAATDPWRTAGAAFAALTGVSNSPYQCMVVDRFVRLSYAITGTTPSLTTAVVAEAV